MATAVAHLALTPARCGAQVSLVNTQAGRRSRRDVLGGSLMCMLFAPAPSAAQSQCDAGSCFKEYQSDRFELRVPKDWATEEGKATGARKAISFHPVDDISASVTVLTTNLGPDFTSLGSLGSVDAFAANVVSSMDRGGLVAKLLNANSKNGMYYVEYSVSGKRHFLSAVGLCDTGFYHQLVTATGQYLEDDSLKYKAAVEQTVASFRVLDSGVKMGTTH